MKLDNLDVIVKNVPAAAAFFRDVVGSTLRVNEERYAELDAGPVTYEEVNANFRGARYV